MDTFVLAGGSYGGYLALGYALAYQNRLSALILRDAWSSVPAGALRGLGAVLTSERISPDMSRQIRLWSGAVRDSEDVGKALAEIVAIYSPEKTEDSEQAGPVAFEGASKEFDLRSETHNAAFSLSAPRFNVRSRFEEIRAPTLVLVGRHDPISPVEEAELIHRGVPGSELVVFEGSGHNPATDEPGAFQEAIDRFINGLEEKNNPREGR